MNETTKKMKVLVVRHHAPKLNKPVHQSDTFHKISVRIANKLGSSKAFFLALLVIVVWGVTGPIFGFSDTWQLVINTGTTIVTFLMVFVIQNTQNRDGKAMQLKLDELIYSSHSARGEFVDIEDVSDEELEELQNQFKKMHAEIELRAKKNTQTNG